MARAVKVMQIFVGTHKPPRLAISKNFCVLLVHNLEHKEHCDHEPEFEFDDQDTFQPERFKTRLEGVISTSR